MQQEHNYIYRFRNSQKLLEFKELENQEIFFSDKAFQNDAFEGNMDLYWSGDEVLWTNFFNNYFMSLFLILFSTSKPTLLTEKDKFTAGLFGKSGASFAAFCGFVLLSVV